MLRVGPRQPTDGIHQPIIAPAFGATPEAVRATLAGGDRLGRLAGDAACDALRTVMDPLEKRLRTAVAGGRLPPEVADRMLASTEARFRLALGETPTAA